MTKIAYIISNLNNQGPVNQLYYLIKHINKDLFDPVIITTTKVEDINSRKEDFENLNVRIIQLNLSKVKTVLNARKIIQEIIINNEIKVVQSFGFRSDWISSGLRNTFKISNIRNTILVNYKYAYGPLFGLLLGNIYLQILKRFDTLVACSEAIQKYSEGLGLKAHCIRNAVEPEKEIKIQETFKNKISFITVSSKTKGKNIEFLVDLFIKKKSKDYMLTIAGHVDDKTIEKYRKQPNINFIGLIPSFKTELLSHDYFISASLHEGMPNAPLEAMSVGLPVLLSDIEPHKEIFSLAQGKKIGYLFKNNNELDIHSCIENVLKEDYTLLSNNCITTLDMVSTTKMTKAYETLYLNSLQK